MAPRKVGRVSEIVALTTIEGFKAKIKEWKMSCGADGIVFFSSDLEALDKLIERLTKKD